MFIARQPIFKRNLEIYGYELLFRSDKNSKSYDGISSEQATNAVLAGLFEQGITKITDDHKAFINFDYEVLNTKVEEVFSPDEIVIEMLESVKITPELLKRLDFLKKKGYTIALDDFVGTIEGYGLMPYATIIKFDILLTPVHEIIHLVKQAKNYGLYCLAEKVETEEEFEQAKAAGFDFFQGYFFSKPQIVGGRKEHIKTSIAVYKQILDEVMQEEPSMRRIAEIIRVNADLSYKLMRMMKNKSDDIDIKTIQRALAYMGLKEIKRWIHVLIMADVGRGKPNELIKLSLMRSLFAENIAQYSEQNYDRYDASIIGLFSLLDAIVDLPMDQALDEVIVSEDVKEALLYQKGKLYPILKLVQSFEELDYDEIVTLADNVRLSREMLSVCYQTAIDKTRELIDIL